MLDLAAIAAALAALFGAVLAAAHLRADRRQPPHAVLRAAHGALGAAAVTALLLAVGRSVGPVSPFLWDAVALLVVAILSGAAFWCYGRRFGEQRGSVLVLHGFVAFVGTLLLAGWALG